MKVHGFNWDGGNWPKCGKHGVTREEIEELFNGRFLIIPALKYTQDEARYIAFGESAKGRDILVVFTLRQASGSVRELIRPISARYMHEKEKRYVEEEAARIQKR